jgi:hypothetical protein
VDAELLWSIRRRTCRLLDPADRSERPEVEGADDTVGSGVAVRVREPATLLVGDDQDLPVGRYVGLVGDRDVVRRVGARLRGRCYGLGTTSTSSANSETAIVR